MYETVNNYIEDAQHRLIQALCDLQEAEKLALLWNDELAGRIKTEIAALNGVDIHLGKIKSGRS